MKRLAYVAAGIALAACTMPDMPEPPEGAALFARNCVSCHGADAQGGVGPDLTKITRRNGGTFPVASVLSQIDGYGKGSAAEAMPEFGLLLQGDLIPVEVEGTLTPTPRPLAALLAYLQSVQDS